MRLLKFYNFFINYLKHPKMVKRIALLLLSGKIEHYIVRDFAYLLHQKSNGIFSGVVNVGRENPKVDLMVINKNKVVQAFMEFKHIPDKNRFWNEKSTGRDNVGKLLDDLCEQLRKIGQCISKGKFEATKQTEFDISKNAEFAGMIIASYYAKGIERDLMEDFFKLIIEKAGQKGFRNYSGRGLTLNKVFENSEVTFAGKRYHISLRLGLWKVTL